MTLCGQVLCPECGSLIFCQNEKERAPRPAAGRLGIFRRFVQGGDRTPLSEVVARPVDNAVNCLRPPTQAVELSPLPPPVPMAELLQHVAILRALLAEHCTSMTCHDQTT
jgi:hypothetical protein